MKLYFLTEAKQYAADGGQALHLGFGRGCLCIDYYRRGRRP